MRTFILGFAAGIAAPMLLEGGDLPAVFSGVATVIGAVVTFVLELGVVAGVGGALLLIGGALLVGREWSERARGRYDAEEANANRSRHRGVNRPRRNWNVVNRPR